MSKDESNDIFKEAARISMEVSAAAKEDEEEDQSVEGEVSISQAELATMHTEEGDKWDNLAKYISGEGAHRLLLELKAMPSRDYVRNYLKLLEHFKPKLVRSDSSPDDEVDRTINIELVQQMPDGEMRTMNISKTDKKNG